MITTKRNRLKRSLSLLLTLAMCTNTVTVSALAEKADSDAEIINWLSLYGNKGTNSLAATCDSINDVQMLTDGSYAAVGAFDGNGITDMEGQKGKTDAAFMLYDENGVMQKQTLVGGTKADYFYKFIEGSNGGFIAVGAGQSEDGDMEGILKGGYDGLICKFDNEGNLEKSVTVGGSSKDELRDIIETYDGGYVAVGYTQSNDGDLTNTGKKATDRDALIVKLDYDLNIQWIKTYGITGTATTGLDDFYSVQVCLDGSYITAGGLGAKDGAASKEKDICLVKYSEEGELLWEKTFGGSGDDCATCISVSPYETSFTEDGDRFSDVELKESGFALTGTTKSSDGIFADSKTESGIEKAFFIKVNPAGEIETADLLENTVGSTGESIISINDGYMITGMFQSSDFDFTGKTVFGKKDFYVAHYSSFGNFLNMTVFGSDDDETVKGIVQGCNDDYILFGNTKSTDFYGHTISGRYDGFLLCAEKNALETYAEEKYLIPVKAWKENEDEPSMMSPLLYKDAYVEKTGEQYKITVYFTNAIIMGSQISASTLGAVSYEVNNSMTAADKDEYDILTQVKHTTITVGNLDKPVKFYINGTMGVIRLVFEEENKISADTPPYFPPVQVTRPDFNCLWKTNIGGSDVDYSNSMTILGDGRIIAAGQTYSNDGDFENLLSGFSSAYINTYDLNGKLLNTAVLGGTNPDSSAYASCVDGAADGGYYVCGGYEESFGRTPSGIFAVLNSEGSVHGQIDGYYAKYDSDGQMLWIKGFSGSAYDQIKQIKATEDGGCVLLIETNSEDGDMAGFNRGIFDLVLMKCDKEGNEQWKKVISGSSMQSASFGTAILQDGSYIVGGYAYLGYTFDDFENLTYYGNTFDIFIVKISENGELIWAKSYGGDGNDYCNSVTATEDGGFMLAGSTKSSTGTFEGIGTSYENPFIMKCDANGVIQWCDVLKSSEKGEAVKVIELAGKYVVLGSGYGSDFDFSNINKGSRDVFIAYYDMEGSRIFLDMIGGINLDYAIDIAAYGNRISMLFDGESTDGDLDGLNRGDFDGTILTFEMEGAENIDKSVLKDILEKAKAIDNTDNKYTELSFNALLEVIKNAEMVYSDPVASQEEVDSQVNFVHSAIEELAEIQNEVLNKDSLKDGSYYLYAYMFKPDRKDYSMADNAIVHKVLLEVINGEYYITLQLKGLSIYNLFGYLADISYYENGYTYNEFGIPNGTTMPVQVISTQKDSAGNDIIDQYNDADNLYPNVIKFRLVSDAVSDADGFVPMSIFVPIMETIAEGNGSQNVLMKLDWSALTKADENNPGFQPEEPVELSPAVDIIDSATGIKVHADKGVFEEGVKLIVKSVISGTDYENALTVLSEIGRKFKLYEIYFEDADGNKIQPNGTVTVSYPIPAEYNAANMVLYRINDDKSKTLIKGSAADNYYTVIVRSFSTYALVEKDNQNTEDVNNGQDKNNSTSDSPQTEGKAAETGDSSNIMLWLLLVSVSGGILKAMIFTKKRQRVNEQLYK